MTNTTAIPSLDEVITPEVRDLILANKDEFVGQLTTALAPLGVKYTFGKSISFCVKQSDQYIGLPKKDQTTFMNKVKSILKAHKVGERMTLEAIARGYWAQFNGSLVDKDGFVKKLNVSLVRGDIKASREDDNIQGDLERIALRQDNAKLHARIRELEVISKSEVKE
jgi:hypothetical protein